MMATRSMAYLAMVAIWIVSSLGASGCLSRTFPQKQRYVLEIEDRVADPTATAATSGRVRLARVRVSPLFARKTFVYRTGPSTYTEDFYNEFFAPPGTVLERAILHSLHGANIFGEVVEGAYRGPCDYILESNIERLYGDIRDRHDAKSVMTVIFKLRDATQSDRPVLFEQSYDIEKSVASASASEIRAGWHSAFSEIMSVLERDLRAHFSRSE